MPFIDSTSSAHANLALEHRKLETRRQLFGRTAASLGSVALASLLDREAQASEETGGGALGAPHFAPRAKRVIYLFQSGGPSQLEMLDHKPGLEGLHGTELPASVRGGQRITLMTANQSSFPCAASKFEFRRHGKCGRLISELLPHIGSIADEIAVIKSIHTEAINHDPALTCLNTGSQQLGKASLGSWLSYGIGSESENLPAYLVLLSQGTGRPNGQPLFSRLWGNGFLPSKHQGVKLRNARDAVLYLNDPPGIDKAARRRFLDGLARINRLKADAFGDPEIDTRIAQYEMAFRMQTSVPELTDISGEPDSTFELYGENARTPGTFAANCLLARRMAERGVRCIQLFHRGWDQHGNLPNILPLQTKDVDQASAALVRDLKQRGMLDETLVLWGGEFGRTVYCQGKLSKDKYGRDHHGRCFSMWMAGGGVRGGIEHGETDDFCYNVVRDPVSVNDLNATILHCLGLDHERLTYKHRGLDERLTGVEGANVIHDLLT
jgi:hypothetical protein